MHIPKLRDRLARIIADYRTNTSLQEGCNVILQHDCYGLQQVEGVGVEVGVYGDGSLVFHVDHTSPCVSC